MIHFLYYTNVLFKSFIDLSASNFPKVGSYKKYSFLIFTIQKLNQCKVLINAYVGFFDFI
jgi:hypothetical protein